jgi:hypothetical protein
MILDTGIQRSCGGSAAACRSRITTNTVPAAPQPLPPRTTTTDAAGAPTFLPAATTDDAPTMTAEEVKSYSLPATPTGRAEAFMQAD